ncbi:MAG: hypothetical protein H6R27_636 [Proteobacteria bacterium]|nr:hypothetical protein [Pseudomonadota bacterium]
MPGGSVRLPAMLHRLRHRSVRDQAVAFILAALVFRALVPAGFMFASGDGASLTVRLCHGAESRLTVVHYDDDGRPVDGRSDHDASGLCPYAASALLAPPPAIDVARSTDTGPATLGPDPAEPLLPRDHARRPGARAPPLVA